MVGPGSGELYPVCLKALWGGGTTPSRARHPGRSAKARPPSRSRPSPLQPGADRVPHRSLVTSSCEPGAHSFILKLPPCGATSVQPEECFSKWVPGTLGNKWFRKSSTRFWKPLAHRHGQGSESTPTPAHEPWVSEHGARCPHPNLGAPDNIVGASPGRGLTHADAVLSDEARGAPGPAHAAQGPGVWPQGDPGMVGTPGEEGWGPRPGRQGAQVADGGHVGHTPPHRGAGLAVREEGVARWAQAAEAALEVVALEGTGPGQLQTLVDVWKEGGGGGPRAEGGSGLPWLPGLAQKLLPPLSPSPSCLHCSEASSPPTPRL